MIKKPLTSLTIGIKGAGEMASGIAHRLYMANLKNIFMMDISDPQAVRRKISFCEALYEHSISVEGILGVKVENKEHVHQAWNDHHIAVAANPKWDLINVLEPDVVIDAILAKENLGTQKNDADLVIGLGPGFVAGKDVHLVIETNRGHNLGRIIETGAAEPNTGIPGNIDGHTSERVFRSPTDGVLQTTCKIGSMVELGEVIATVDQKEIKAKISGVVRGILRNGSRTFKGMKLGDIDPRGNREYCYNISDKSRNISGTVLEAIMRYFNVEGKGI